MVALLARLPGDEWSNEEAEFCYDSFSRALIEKIAVAFERVRR